MDLGLKGKVAIVTGGSNGIGMATAMRLAPSWARRIAICARGKDGLDQAAREISAKNEGAVLSIQGDVGIPQDIERVVDTTMERFGRIDILVNNAGESSADNWQADFNLKLWSAIRFAHAVIPHMREAGGGRIINMTNLGAKAPGPSSVPTSVVRAAGVAVTKAMSKDLGKDNILVNTVCIGVIKSGQHERRYKLAKAQNPTLTLEEHYAQVAMRREVPLGRVGEAEEAGDVIAFLASERASYLSGIAVNIDGGASPVV